MKIIELQNYCYSKLQTILTWIFAMSNPTNNLPPEYTDAENSLPMILSVWWSFSWRFVLLFIAASFIIGLILTIVTGGDLLAAERWGGALSLLVGIPISIWSLGKALSCAHKQHRIIFTKQVPDTE